MNNYNKVLTKILDCSIWLEDSDTRIVWITLLAAMDEDGFCPFSSPANVANRARVAPAAAIAALKKFEGHDPLTSEDESRGRRIERVPGGYIVLNAIRHREQVTREEIRKQDAERARRYREKKKNVTPTVTLDRDFVTLDRDATDAKETDITTPTPSRETVMNVTENRDASRNRHAISIRSRSKATTKTRARSRGSSRRGNVATCKGSGEGTQEAGRCRSPLVSTTMARP